jgi:glycosyltransferase involved in cell wall biosynthesis
MWKNKRVSVVFSTYREKNSIRKFIDDCFKTGYVDEVIVVNNNAEKGTNEEVKKTKAKLYYEPKQGFGAGYQLALKKSTGDLIIMSEPDGTFLASDIEKLLSYSDDFEIVQGTRTTQATIMKGANMGLFLKWGNWFVAKLIEVLFSTTHLCDAGCTYRLMSRRVYEKIKNQFTISSLEFNVELTLLYIKNNIKIIEVPVHYLKRVGKSSVTGDFLKSFQLGLIMIGLVLKYRFGFVKPKIYKNNKKVVIK